MRLIIGFFLAVLIGILLLAFARHFGWEMALALGVAYLSLFVFLTREAKQARQRGDKISWPPWLGPH